ncbi:MAG: DUF4956 domain-containing protein [bacterium]
MDFNFIDFQNIDGQNFLEFILRFVFNFIVIYIIAKGIYFKVRRRSNILFALFLLNILVFFVCYLLQSVQLSIGFAFGIFAIFSILRYRTTTVPIKEMTYIFISISIAIINALTNINTGYGIMLFTNVTIVLFTYAFEKKFIRNESVKTVLYDKIELIKPEHQEELIQDLKDRTGLDIHRIEIGRIDFLRDIARIRIFYYDVFNTDDAEFFIYED